MADRISHSSSSPRAGRERASRSPASPAAAAGDSLFPATLAGSVPFLMNWASSRLNLDLMQDLRPLKITAGRWRVLLVLTARNGASISELAQDCAMEQSTLSRIVDQMERDGLAERRLLPEDNRITQVFLTEEGSRLYAFVLPTAQAEAARLLDPLSAEEQQALANFLRRVADGLRGSPPLR